MPQHIRSEFKNQRNLGHDGSENIGPSGKILIAQDRDWETDTKQAVSVIKRTELTFSSTEIVMVNPRNLEAVVNQRQYFQNTVVVLVLGSRERMHEAFDVIKLARLQEVTLVVGDQKKPDEPEERGRSTLVTAIQTGKGTMVCKHCRRRFHGDNNISVGSSCGHECVDKCAETSRGLGRNDHVTERDCLDPCEIWEEVPNTDVGAWGNKRNALETNTCQGSVDRKRTRWTSCERGHQRWTRAQDEGHACVGRLQVDIGETPVRKCTSWKV